MKGASPGRVPASLLKREVGPKLARWAESDDEGAPDIKIKMEASPESARRSEMSAEGWLAGSDHLWRNQFENAEWMPACDVGGVGGGGGRWKYLRMSWL